MTKPAAGFSINDFKVNMAARKHGDKTTVDLALDAIRALGRPSTATAVRDRILADIPAYNPSNVGPDLNSLAVNSASRVHYSGNKVPRRTDTGHKNDALFKVSQGSSVTYEAYDPAQHGVWEIFLQADSDGNAKPMVRRLDETLLAIELTEAEAAQPFDARSDEDARHKVSATIVQRRGQPAFRKALFEAYGGRCAVTGCSTSQVLEAAHISPYKGEHTNHVQNGLLLRADVHTLFDLGLIWVDGSSMQVQVAPSLDGTEYGSFHGECLHLPVDVSSHPCSEALNSHAAKASRLLVIRD